MKATWPNKVLEDGKQDFLKDLFNTIKSDGMPKELVGGSIRLYKAKKELEKVIVFHNEIELKSIPFGVRRAWYRLIKNGYKATIKNDKTHCIITTNAFPGDLEQIFNNVKFFNKHIVVRYQDDTFEIQCKV